MLREKTYKVRTTKGKYQMHLKMADHPVVSDSGVCNRRGAKRMTPARRRGSTNWMFQEEPFLPIKTSSHQRTSYGYESRVNHQFKHGSVKPGGGGPRV